MLESLPPLKKREDYIYIYGSTASLSPPSLGGFVPVGLAQLSAPTPGRFGRQCKPYGASRPPLADPAFVGPAIVFALPLLSQELDVSMQFYCRPVAPE